MVSRRRFLRLTGAIGLSTTVAGCAGEEPTETDEPTPTASPTASATETAPSTPTATATETGTTVVDVGPEGRLRFDPEEIEISVGDTVEWIARSEGHNVTSHPDASNRCQNPEGAEPFQSYEGDDHFAIMEIDEVFTHEFTVAGEYVYVCTPHDDQGMIGTVVVTE